MEFKALPINTTAQYLLNDSRQLSSPQRSIFFAIKGLHHDGHLFLDDLYRKGVREFVVETDALSPAILRELKKFTDAKIWQVEDSITAMQEVAQRHREQFNLPVIGITGSNGKTIVKEWLAQLLSNRFKIVKSPKSYNSQIGVPLSVWQINESHNLGIFEVGISKVEEMEKLEKVVKPSIGIFTNIGTAHNEFFSSNSQKIKEKIKLFKHASTLIYCADYVAIDEIIKTDFMVENPDCKIINWSRMASTGARVSWEIYNENTKVFLDLTAISPNTERFSTTLDIPFTDEASIENAIHCILTLWYLGYSTSDIQARLQILRPVSMRLEMKQGTNANYLIDDTYNNDLAGLTIALNFLSQQKQKQKKVLILSDLLETGVPEKELYKQIAHLVKERHLEQFIGIGDVISRNKNHFMASSVKTDTNIQFYKNTKDFLESQAIKSLHNSTILIKGARKYGFEQIVNRLVQKTHGTILEINLDAITNNLNYYRDKVGQQIKMMVMVKAFAYGSGSTEVANLLQFHGVDYLAVAYTDEGVSLRQNGVYLPIMVMNPSPNDFEQLVAYSLEPEIYSLRILHEFSEYIDSRNLSSKIHLKIDTGMHRLGFEKEALPELLKSLQSNPNLWVSTIFSHLAAADDADLDDFTRQQVKTFTEMANEISEALGYIPSRHLANSAGIARFPEARLDMVRLGIGLYGVAAKPEDQVNLQTVGTLKTVISQIKHIKSSETVGYGRKGELKRDTKIATIAIGYADGFDRGYGRGVGEVLVNGHRCKVVGNVCMDMTMVDITDVPNVQEGDEVIIFNKELTITELSQKINTIPYEVLTSVSERVKRVFYQL
ncbi:bifunctional UDP-N-acetylmuramoyl-tripeptide:D-alanyl-D-alanine ligase/alanine racemase [Arcicella aquatica]|uniref:Alanine racemase n=1 Tax=Arcicella aquatica TaxID=217141 RepID=A0ABU5QPA9_9BACT|nr:bifunctional UDP-N-acetylmuramoyl-tripeptide:D-alanyl-D-alanine ligase/alanine racemase [Arcicella aquatica]MEA5258911.1 bifunctional UDP-N-acetylmuramoyl-tripeptide:D-alanyl-D-alanine ligase/alanine racemase [Arcicella aquatica]